MYIGSIFLTLIAAVSFLMAGNTEYRFALHGVPLDDVWIHQVYARSIADGHPFEYNPGEHETGSTSPLWVVLLAPVHLFGLPINLTAKVFCILFTTMAGIAGYKLARIIGMDIAGCLFMFIFPLLPYFTFAAVSGSEVPLFILLSLLTITLALSKKIIWAGVSAGFTILARPEGFLIAFLFVISVIGNEYFNRPYRQTSSISPVNTLTLFFTPLVIILTPWILYCLSVTGMPLPMTFYIKAHWFGMIDIDQFTRIAALLATQPFIGSDTGLSAFTAIAFVLGVILYFYGLGILKRHSISAFILIGLLGPVYLYTASMIVPLGNPLGADRTNSVQNFYFARYLIPGFVPILFVSMLGFSSVIQKKSKRAYSLGIVVSILTIISIGHQHVKLRDVYSTNCQNIQELQVRTAQWIDVNLPAGKTVAVSDAGAIRYFGNHRVIDLMGLNTHRLRGYVHAINERSDQDKHDRVILDNFLLKEHPDYLAVTRDWHEPLINNHHFEHLYSVMIDNNTICGGNEILILKPDIP